MSQYLLSVPTVDGTARAPMTKAAMRPFVEAKEHIAGFYIIQADDLGAALRWGARTTEAVGAPIEVRPF